MLARRGGGEPFAADRKQFASDSPLSMAVSIDRSTKGCCSSVLDVGNRRNIVHVE
jgi:hypothetical protein